MDQYHALKVLADSEGGEILIEQLTKEIVQVVDTLAGGYRDMSLQEFIAHAARISTNLNMVRSLSRAAENYEGALDTLENMLRQ